ncbi:RloB family protein [Lacinutrix sp. C3R15]|uniref:RloB family protein n=1 Tax=Flavobacteriaceae TaxID=49546 RepID=UPI001C0A203A|nr:MULTISPECIES: RloB family protein [Flavobacteriaceae]MBU2937913.1 RloB family protein [Lacinutrix sp. C3R15]MDO6621227.1 RloB family protein [Oceanihabitans sp. 1_MG-2023]
MKMEPWEIKSDDSREVDTKRVFIIFCEDGAVEPAYFDLFKKEGLQVSTIGNAKQHHAQVDYATEYFRKSDLIEVNDHGQEVLKIDEGAQVWCVFDRDREPDDGKDSAFNDSIIAANSKGIKTAWSNDDFELWVLLHFEDIDPANEEFHNRSKYYERLTDILKEYYPEVDKFKNPRFNYYESMKGKSMFLRYTYQIMKGKLEDAIRRAKELEVFHQKVLKPSHLHCPCTKVHTLVLELLNE